MIRAYSPKTYYWITSELSPNPLAYFVNKKNCQNPHNSDSFLFFYSTIILISASLMPLPDKGETIGSLASGTFYYQQILVPSGTISSTKMTWQPQALLVAASSIPSLVTPENLAGFRFAMTIIFFPIISSGI